jgi:kinesin family member 18/19
MAELFQRIEERKEDYSVDVSLSFLEIYNEEIRDLLAPAGLETPRGGLAIREDKNNRVTVAGLTEVIPTSADEVNSIVQAGNARRTQSPTHANATSSRSHAVLQINVTQSPRTPGVIEERTMATLSIIDLAGSERAAATKNMGKRMVEGANINKSLLALGNCINALCEPRTRAHIPYRNSKLTRLLKFSLGGNCRTVMIVCVAPTSNHLEDTGNTLAYANRAKEIKTKVSKNIMDVDRHVGQYVEAINRLNDEVRELKAKLAGEMALENEAMKRRRVNATKAVESIRAEIRALASKSKTALCTASFTAGNIAASHAKMEIIRARIKEIDAQGELTTDLETEKELLSSIAATEDSLIQKGSDTVNRGTSTDALFKTNVGLAQKRTSEEWDESAPALLKMEGEVALAEMRAAQAEHERDGLKVALAGQAKVVAALVGMLARTNVLIGDGAQLLRAISDSAMTPEEIANKLEMAVNLNNKSFNDVLGVSVQPLPTNGKSAFSSLKSQPVQKKRPSPIGVPSVPRPRSSAGGRRSSLGGLGSPGRRGHGFKSPRRQSVMRQSISISRRGEAEKKSVRWAVPIKPDESYVEPVTPTQQSTVPLPAAENEWEDDKTDDSSVTGSMSGASLSLDAAALSWSNGTTPPSTATNVPGQRIKMAALKSKTALSSLKEENESTPRRTILGDLNGAPTSQDTSASNNKIRKKSNVGPVRSPRPRRRSSLIPQLSPMNKSATAADLSTKKSPKKSKRNSLLTALTTSRMRPSLLKIGVETPTNAKPTWK